jgi:hypothetical protein
MFDVIYFHAVMLVRYVMSLIKATYLLTYLLTYLFSPLHAPLTLHCFQKIPLPLPLIQFSVRSAPFSAPLMLRSHALLLTQLGDMPITPSIIDLRSALISFLHPQLLSRFCTTVHCHTGHTDKLSSLSSNAVRCSPDEAFGL